MVENNTKKTDEFALLSLILSLVFALFVLMIINSASKYGGVPIPSGIISRWFILISPFIFSFIIGIIGYIRTNNEKLTGRGLSITAILISVIFMAILIPLIYSDG